MTTSPHPSPRGYWLPPKLPLPSWLPPKSPPDCRVAAICWSPLPSWFPLPLPSPAAVVATVPVAAENCVCPGNRVVYSPGTVVLCRRVGLSRLWRPRVAVADGAGRGEWGGGGGVADVRNQCCGEGSQLISQICRTARLGQALFSQNQKVSCISTEANCRYRQERSIHITYACNMHRLCPGDGSFGGLSAETEERRLV